MQEQTSSQIIKKAIARLLEGKDLSRDQSRLIMKEIMEQRATDAQISAYLIAMQMKGETVDEIQGSAEAMHTEKALLSFDDANIVDTCGTGGAHLSTFNISTVAAFVTAGAGVKVAKHGHYSVSGKCGSADLLKRLGVNITSFDKTKMRECIDRIGITFIIASNIHNYWRYAQGPRQEIGARTIFNLLGPITNPARIRRQLIGVYDKDLMQKLAQVMRELGSEHVMIVHGQEGLDEISITGTTYIAELINDAIEHYEIVPEDFGFKTAGLSSIQSYSCEQSVKILHEVLQGIDGPPLDTVLLNAGAAIKVSGRVSSLKEGIELAKESVCSGSAREKLNQLIEFTQAF